MKKFSFIALLGIVFSVALYGAACAADTSWKLAGTWNYTCTIKEQDVTIQEKTFKFSGSEAGTLNVTMQDGEEANREYFKEILLNCKGTAIVDGTSYPYEVKDYTQNFESGQLYTPGNEISYHYRFEVNGVEYHERVKCTQIEENKITGTITLEDENSVEICKGEISATRNSSSGSSSGGGCNAGFGALALLLAVPMFRRKK